MRRNEVQGVAVPTIDISKLGVADADGVLQHGCKHRLKIAGRAADDLEHLRRRRLLLQRFGKLARALLLRLEQPRVLDRDHRLVGEGLDQLDLLLSERPYGSAMQDEHANRNPLSQKRHAEDCAKVAELLRFHGRYIPDQQEHPEFERICPPAELDRLHCRVPAQMIDSHYDFIELGV